jgi:long-chain acyl-CoA synthetase
MTNSTHSTIAALLSQAVVDRGDAPALGIIAADGVAWTTWRQLAALVAKRVDQLGQIGIVAGDRVALCGPNSLDWIVNDLALHTIGGVSVPLHVANPQQLNRQLVEIADARLLIDGSHSIGAAVLRPTRHRSPADLSTIIFTSGTTSLPLGVMLSQQNLLANAMAVSQAAPGDGNETRLAILPFSHAYGRTCDLYVWLVRQSRMVLSRGREHLLDDLRVAQPTAVLGVPYLFSKLAAAAQHCSLVELCGGQLRRGYSGGAPLAREIVQTFAHHGVVLSDGYGLTEASPVVAMDAGGDLAAGASSLAVAAVGKPLPNIEVEIATDGEILVRGPSVMLGYWHNDEATARALRDGWLHTGDVGQFRPDGTLEIVGRKKELIVLATGKKVAPAAIEARLTASPLVEQALVIGEGRTHLLALIVPNPERLRAEVGRRRLWVWSKRQAVNHRQIRSWMGDEIERCTRDLAPHERPRHFEILSRGFSLEKGEMTAKLSLRRQQIEQNFHRQIAKQFANPKTQ